MSQINVVNANRYLLNLGQQGYTFDISVMWGRFLRGRRRRLRLKLRRNGVRGRSWWTSAASIAQQQSPMVTGRAIQSNTQRLPPPQSPLQRQKHLDGGLSSILANRGGSKPGGVPLSSGGFN